MSYHIISIDEADCHISVACGQLQVRSATGTRSAPLEDVASIIISSYRCSLSSHFLVQAAQQGIGVVICDCHKPAALLLPADRATDTALLRNLAKLPPRLARSLWQKTLSAKCMNQGLLARQWDPAAPEPQRMQHLAAGEKVWREAEVAKLFWRSFAAAADMPGFRRGRDAGGCNALFNYSYAVLLSYLLGRLFAIGLDPTFGIFHAPRAHAAPLAYDLMEPFRPIFDANILRWIHRQRKAGVPEAQLAEVSPDFRRHILGTLLAEVPYRQASHPLRYVVELVLRSFRAAVSAQLSSPYEPWILSTIKWAG